MEIPPFPCVDERSLHTKPYCGILLPPNLIEKYTNIIKKPETTWTCWLCDYKENYMASHT